MTGKAKGVKRTIEKGVQFALGHPIRVHILMVLNQQQSTASQLAKIIDESLNNVSNHLREMVNDGSVEIASENLRGNVVQYQYKAVDIPQFSVEEWEALHPERQQNIVGSILQAATAEVLGAFYARVLLDSQATLFWDWINLDSAGRRTAAELTERYIANMRNVEAEATERVARTGERTTTMFLDIKFFRRAREASARKPPLLTRSCWLAPGSTPVDDCGN